MKDMVTAEAQNKYAIMAEKYSGFLHIRQLRALVTMNGIYFLSGYPAACLTSGIGIFRRQ